MAVRHFGKFRQRDLAGEADDAVVARMHPQDGGGVWGNGVLIIFEVRAIGRADFDQSGLALGHHFRQPERAADLDELAPRDDDLLLRGQRRQHQHRGGGVVIDHRSRFRARKLSEDRLDQFVPLNPFATLAVHSQRRVALQLGQHRIYHAAGKYRPSQARVQDDARRVDCLAEMGCRSLLQQRRRASQQRLRRHLLGAAVAGGIGEQLLAHACGRAAQAIGHQRQWMRLQPPDSRRGLEEFGDGRNAFQQLLFRFRCHSLRSFNHALGGLSMIFGRATAQKAPGDRRQGGGGGEPRGKKRSVTEHAH